MKSFAFSALALTASCNAFALERRYAQASSPAPAPQGGIAEMLTGGIGSMLSGAVNNVMDGVLGAVERKPVSVKTVPSQLQKEGTIRKRARYGPFTLPGAKDATPASIITNETGSIFGIDVIQTPCSECIVLAGGVSLEHPDGTVANISTGIYNHHVIALNTGKQQNMALCPGKSPASFPATPAFLVGSDSSGTEQLYTSTDGSFKSGNYVKPGDKVILNTMLMNYKPQSQDVYVNIDTEYLPGKPAGFMDAYSIQISASDCGLDGDMKLKGKKDKFTTGDWTVPVDGYIMNMEGHLHDGGSEVVGYINEKPFCTSSARYGPSAASPEGAGMSDGMKEKRDNKEVLVGMSKCTEPTPIKKGDKIKITAGYDLDAHPQRQEATGGQMGGVMGMAVFSFAFPMGFNPAA